MGSCNNGLLQHAQPCWHIEEGPIKKEIPENDVQTALHWPSRPSDCVRGEATLMPAIPFIDTHVHLWDPTRFTYPWLKDVPSIDRPHALPEFTAASAGLPLEGMVFMECDSDRAEALSEALWIDSLAAQDPRLKGLVAFAPLENGGAVAAHLERLAAIPLVRGVRRLIQSEAEGFCLQAAFIDGARLLARFGFSFDICIRHPQLGEATAFARQLPDIPMILDHIGKPAIRDHLILPWADEMRELARLPHVMCKISGVATEADSAHWTKDDLKRYVAIAIEAFGFDRVMFGGDWPVSTLAISYPRWIEILDELLAGVSTEEQSKFWRGNAERFYRLA